MTVHNFLMTLPNIVSLIVKNQGYNDDVNDVLFAQMWKQWAAANIMYQCCQTSGNSSRV